MVKIASYNVENLYARPRAFNRDDWTIGEPILDAYNAVNDLFMKPVYMPADKRAMIQHLVKLEIYYVNTHGAVRRKRAYPPKWAWLRQNRGKFDSQPQDTTRDVEIVADGRDSWIGWVELTVQPTNELATRLTAKVISEVDADIIGVVEAEDRPSLVRFNEEMLGALYGHVMLVDGNDKRGIDVGIMTRDGFDIERIRSNVDAEDAHGTIFSRDCPEYEVHTPSGATVYVLVNHFKSQLGGGHTQRRRQASEVRDIANRLVAQGKDVIVVGDLNEGPPAGTTQAVSLSALYSLSSPLTDCYSLQGFDVGPRPGTWRSCGIGNRLDYVFISQGLRNSFRGGGLFRKGLWGNRKTRPNAWHTYQEMTESAEQASDHALVWIELDI